ncbi:hypothetical protein RRG08_018096 [Elysia crispata]|uniref:Uncharacterized protein n=1 Tax=Elysia crispata TaxID=231223 RepID=A0AAE0ZE39_9GAST|nr:hypothetical protein RRG08_018096 [Elysia crispata]
MKFITHLSPLAAVYRNGSKIKYKSRRTLSSTLVTVLNLVATQEINTVCICFNNGGTKKFIAPWSQLNGR